MFHASTLLKNTRLDKELEIAEISKKLRIKPKYIEAIESEDVASFPQEPYCSLFVKDYAEFLGLNGQEILRIFRRDFAQKLKIKSSSRKTFSFTPQFTFKISLIATILFFSVYLTTEFLKFNRPPKLLVNWPGPSMILGQTLDLTGITDPESTVRINQDLIIVDSKGNFQKKINLNSGDNKIIVESKSPSGKTTAEEKIITANN